MHRDSQYRQLIESMQEARERYLEVANKYDGFLQNAHQHETQALIDAVRSANAMGSDLTLALKECRDAVKSLARVLQKL
jgi:hypothetical protein